MLHGYLRPMNLASSVEEAPPSPSTCTAMPDDGDQARGGLEPLTPETTPRSKKMTVLQSGTRDIIRDLTMPFPGTAIRVPDSATSRATRGSPCPDSTRSDATVLPVGSNQLLAVHLHDKFFSFAASPEDQPGSSFTTGVAEQGDFVDMARYLQESPPATGPSSGSFAANEPRPARPEKPPNLSRDADRGRKCSAREWPGVEEEKEVLSNPCVNLQQKLLGIRVAAAGTGETVEDGHSAAADDVAALAYKRRSFADMYHL